MHGWLESAKAVGFLSDPDRTQELKPPFEQFHQLASSAPELLSLGKLGRSIQQLPVVDRLPQEDELAHAKMTLSFLVQAFVWETSKITRGNPRTVVPEQLTAPLMNVSEALDEPPIYLYADHTLRNTRLKSTRGGHELSNLEAIFTFSGTDDEDQFVVVHTAYEAMGVPAVTQVIDALSSNDEYDNMGNRLQSIIAAIQNMRTEFLKVKEIVSPRVFRDEIRLFLMGWHGNHPAIEYAGSDIEAGNLRGETGAGSGLLPLLDEFAQTFDESAVDDAVANRDVNMDSVLTYRDFVKYRPREHRQLLKWVGERSKLREAVSQGRVSRRLYNALLSEMRELRFDHLRTVGAYLKDSDHPMMADGVGTGGSVYSKYLLDLVKVNECALIR